MIPLFAGICLLIALAGKAQLADITRAQPYLAVFAHSDAFDSSYFTVLEKGYTSALPDILMAAMGNEFACYRGCRQWNHYYYSL